jgi:hypothetical protein
MPEEPEPSAPASAKSARATIDSLAARVIAIVPLATFGLLWSNYHLGVGAGHPELISAVAAVLPVALGLAAALLDPAEHKIVKTLLRALVVRLLTWRLIVLLYLIFGTVALTRAAVVVLAEDGGNLGHVTLRALDDASAKAESASPTEKGAPARFFVFTQPFGRPFRLELDGYVPTAINVYPIVGRQIRPSADLRRSPSILLRLSEIAKGSWSDFGGAELRVTTVVAGGAQQLIAVSKEPAAALLLGRTQPIPSAWDDRWKIELLARGITIPMLVARHLLDWRNPRLLAPASALEPGMTLRVSLTNSEGHVLAGSEFVLGSDELQDQSIGDIEP